MKTVVEYNRKIKTGHTLCPALKEKKNQQHFNSRVHEDGIPKIAPLQANSI